MELRSVMLGIAALALVPFPAASQESRSGGFYSAETYNSLLDAYKSEHHQLMQKEDEAERWKGQANQYQHKLHNLELQNEDLRERLDRERHRPR
jgi:TolA-binding protein